jgi:hypothetical protein
MDWAASAIKLGRQSLNRTSMDRTCPQSGYILRSKQARVCGQGVPPVRGSDFCLLCRAQVRTPLKLIIAPRVPALQVPGGRAFGYPKQLDRAPRRNLKPTSRPISKCPRSTD